MSETTSATDVNLNVSKVYAKDEQLEHEYSPSRWSHRMGPDEIIQSHIDTLTKLSDEAKSALSISCTLNVEYGPSEKQKFDTFKAENPNGAPVLLYIHGGYWQALGREISSFMVKSFVSAGASVVCIGYDLAPDANMDMIVSQVKNATSKVLELAKEWQSSGVYLCGHSAGGHLAAMVLADEELDMNNIIKGAALVSGVFTLEPLVYTYVNDPIGMDLESAKRNSPQQYVSTICKKYKNAELIVAASDHDPPAFIKQSQTFNEAMKSEGVNSSYMLIENTDHFNVIEQLSDSQYILTKKILQMMKI